MPLCLVFFLGMHMTTGSWARGSRLSASESNRAWTGSDDPNKKSINPYRSSGYTAVREPSLMLSTYPVYGAYRDTLYVAQGVFSYPPYNDGDVVNQALSKLAVKLRGHDFNLGSFTAELGQSTLMVKSSAEAVLNSLIQLKRGNATEAVKLLGLLPGQRELKEFRKALKASDISSAWLALKLGWEPLLGDMFEAAKAIETLHHQRQTSVRVTSEFRRTGIDDSSAGDGSILSNHRSSVCLHYTLSDTISPFRSLSVSNPLTTLWEILPWSFVADWIVDIGSYLDNVGFFCGITGTGYMSYLRAGDAKMVRAPKSGSPYYFFSGGNFTSRSYLFERTIGLPSVPLPSLQAMERVFSSSHCKNAAALIHQLSQKFKETPFARDKFVQFDKLTPRRYKVWNSLPRTL